MTPLAAFEASFARAEHLLKLYSVICDTRERGIRSDWAAAFKELMRWPDREQIVRIDGEDRNSLLILRAAAGIDRDKFAHDYTSELLRASVVAAVSAIDRLMHDSVVKYSWKILRRKEGKIPRELAKLAISVVDARKALEHLRKDSRARPGNLIKAAIQQKLHREFTFQSPDAIQRAGAMLGIKDFWAKVATKMPVGTTLEGVTNQLREISARRNQIVHEADLVVTRRNQASLRDISPTQAGEWVAWIGTLGRAINGVIEDTV
ncbi:MAG: hypothetical protein U1F39_06750 [Steroidobacteraceae bacterium]